ncbi:Uncharacterised protein [Mycobacteroides abscessus subsp. abscessus]|nr:Uncharacterised protein [Mycobacteroides abscessus subsp. abscessus]
MLIASSATPSALERALESEFTPSLMACSCEAMASTICVPAKCSARVLTDAAAAASPFHSAVAVSTLYFMVSS